MRLISSKRRFRLQRATSPREMAWRPTCKRSGSTVSVGHSRQPQRQVPAHKLCFENVVKSHFDRRRIRAAQGEAELELADIVRADRERDLVKLSGRVAVDGEEDAAVVESLSAVLVGAEPVRFALALELAFVRPLHRPGQHDALFAAATKFSRQLSKDQKQGDAVCPYLFFWIPAMD